MLGDGSGRRIERGNLHSPGVGGCDRSHGGNGHADSGEYFVDYGRRLCDYGDGHVRGYHADNDGECYGKRGGSSQLRTDQQREYFCELGSNNWEYVDHHRDAFQRLHRDSFADLRVYIERFDESCDLQFVTGFGRYNQRSSDFDTDHHHNGSDVRKERSEEAVLAVDWRSRGGVPAVLPDAQTAS